jgi:hypothetical protein
VRLRCKRAGRGPVVLLLSHGVSRLVLAFAINGAVSSPGKGNVDVVLEVGNLRFFGDAQVARRQKGLGLGGTRR